MSYAPIFRHYVPACFHVTPEGAVKLAERLAGKATLGRATMATRSVANMLRAFVEARAEDDRATKADIGHYDRGARFVYVDILTTVQQAHALVMSATQPAYNDAMRP